MGTPTNSIYSEVTNLIIEEIDTNQALPWVKDWKNGASSLPVNGVTHRQYNGINVLILWILANKNGYTSNHWMTFQQGKKNGSQIRKGEKGTKIIFYKNRTVKDIDTQEEKDIPVIQTFTVFNRDQFLGDDLAAASTNEALPLSDQFISNISHELVTGDPAYLPSLDQVRMPAIDTFNHSGAFYSNYFHELTHWTGHKSRLNRTQHKRFGDHAYMAEELVAELGSAFLCAELAVSGDNRHAGYIEGWLKLLKQDNKAIFTAAA